MHSLISSRRSAVVAACLLTICGCFDGRIYQTKVSVGVYASGFFVFDRNLYPDDRDLLDYNPKKLPPKIGMVIEGTSEEPTAISIQHVPTWVPTEYGGLRLSFYATNSTLDFPMRLQYSGKIVDPGKKLERADSVTIEFDPLDIFLVRGGYSWHSQDFVGKPISPAFTTTGEVAESLTIWAELHAVYEHRTQHKKEDSRSIPNVLSLTHIRPQLEEALLQMRKLSGPDER